MTATRAYDLAVDVVAVAGPDAGSFLQSLLSQDLDPLQVGESAPALLLQPQGKLVATLRAMRVAEDAWWLVTDSGAGRALAEGLNRFRIRVKADVTDCSEAFGAIAVRGPQAGDLVSGVAAEGLRTTTVHWPGEPAFDIIGPRAEVALAREQLVAVGAVAASKDDYEGARIAAGVPRLGVDIDDRTIPQEAFLDEWAVSFTKGCFLGQELVCRIDTRGHVNRYLRRVHIDGGSPPPGAEIVVGDRVVGQVTSVAGSNALAMVRREIEPPAAVMVRWPDAEANAHVETL
jgi:folate-binding protein YgfZ